jgi:hypothetical protein
MDEENITQGVSRYPGNATYAVEIPVGGPGGVVNPCLDREAIRPYPLPDRQRFPVPTPVQHPPTNAARGPTRIAAPITAQNPAPVQAMGTVVKPKPKPKPRAKRVEQPVSVAGFGDPVVKAVAAKGRVRNLGGVVSAGRKVGVKPNVTEKASEKPKSKPNSKEPPSMTGYTGTANPRKARGSGGK